MKTAFLAEFHTARRILLQLLGIYTVLSIVLSVFIGPIIMVTCTAAMTPLLLLFSLAAYDSLNSWERFRACLPVSRNAVVCARYAMLIAGSLLYVLLAFALALALQAAANILPLPAETAAKLLETNGEPFLFLAVEFLGFGLVMVVLAVMAPFIIRYGLTKATRFIPALFIVLAPSAFSLLSNVLDTSNSFVVGFDTLMSTAGGQLAVAGVVLVFVLAISAVSCFAACRMYRSKEL